MPTYFTPNRHGYSVRFSPYNPDRLVVATSQYFGLAGGGTLFFLELSQDNVTIVKTHKVEWTDGLFDVVWSEATDGVAVSGSGDGGLQVWRVGAGAAPVQVLKEHRKEVYSVDWSRTRRAHHVLSASWDCSVKLWDPNVENSLNTFLGHSQLVYNAMFSPHIPNTFASVSGDGYLKIWNCMDSTRASTSIKAHDAEVLSCDWCKYEQNILCTSGSDGLIRGWDIRNLTNAIFELKGCEYAVRRVQFSPHSLSVLASVSYDFTTRIWDFKRGSDPMETIKHHTEFTYGLDWNVLRKNQLADCGWDSLVHVFTPRSLVN